MSNLVFAAIMPHGDYIPELGGANLRKMAQTHAAALEVERLLQESHPDTIVIATPHGITAASMICVGATPRASGQLKGRKSIITADIEIDMPFAQLLCDDATEANLPVAQYRADPPDSIALPLDWGVIIPLWYCGLRIKQVKRYKFVIVCPANNIQNEDYIAFGKGIAKAADITGKRIAFIASCDWAHAHVKDGPYGFHPAAKQFDEQVQEIIASGELERLAQIDTKLADNAMSDGVPQALLLHGAISDAGLDAALLSYERPTYFGMLVAVFSSR
jgi:aromatic ring-opening dioxygenase LigB subunit